MTSKTKPIVSEYRTAAMALIQGESTLTLATDGDDGPWSAPVYFVCLNACFYFFSSPDSLHIRQAMEMDAAAASLFHQADSWQQIRGVQMKGKVTIVRSVSLSLKVISKYLKRFPTTLDFFPGIREPDLDAFMSRFKARLYVFIPIDVYYMDNRFGFGARQRIEW